MPRGFDYRRRRPWLAWGAEREWPPLNPIPADPNTYVYIASDHTTDPPPDTDTECTCGDIAVNVGAVIATDHRDCLGREIGAYNTGDMTAGGVWPVANTAILIPFRVWSDTRLVQKMFYIGSLASGNGDMGMYDANLNLITSTGSFAGAADFDPHAITPTAAAQPYTYMALAFDNTSQKVYRATNISGGGSGFYEGMGMISAASSFPLPAIITPDVPYSCDYVPYMGISYRTVV